MTSFAHAAAAMGNERSWRLFAGIAVALTLSVIVASAFMRHAQAGLGCADWPSCYGRIVAEVPPMPPSTGVQVARALHRVAASLALLSVLAMLFLAPSAGPSRHQRKLAVAALAIALFLAALGIATPDARLPAVPLGNLIGGYLMLAVLAALAGTAADAGQDSASLPSLLLRRLVLALLAFVVVQSAIGGLIGTQFALRECPALDACAASKGAFTDGAALDPFHAPVIVSGHVVPPSGAGTLHWMHRPLGIAIAVAALAIAFALRSSCRRGAALLAVLALAAPLLGATAILGMPSLAATVLHNAAAATTIATLAYVAALRISAAAPQAAVPMPVAAH
jgi:cytochrome c oxidase assembly protein subunit 15